MNNISKKQNEETQLEFLFAQRNLYSSAKNLFGWRTVIAVCLAIGGPFLTSLDSQISVYVAILAVAYLLLDNLLLQKIESSQKITASKVQELFDINVLELSWNNIVTGKQPDKEIIASILSKNSDRDYKALQLVDWYSSDVSKVDLSTGRFLCQRSNVWWDSSLRKKYLNFLYLSSAIVALGLIIAGIALDLTIGVLIIGVVLPVIPLIELLIKQINEHHGSDCCSTDLKDNLNDTLTRIINGEVINNPESLARTYQDEIYRHRSKCPMVFDWMYWIFKDKQEEQMQFSVSKTVKEICRSQ